MMAGSVGIYAKNRQNEESVGRYCPADFADTYVANHIMNLAASNFSICRTTQKQLLRLPNPVECRRRDQNQNRLF